MVSLGLRPHIWLLAALALAMSVPLASSQTISGTIVGTVLDQQGGILSGVGMTVTNTETGLAYEGVTDTQRGMYLIPEVPPGLYRVRAEFSGFQTQEHYPVRVDVNHVTEENFVLKISASTTVLVVQSDAPMTESNTATQGRYLNQTQIRELPVLSRDVNNLALLAAGVESVSTFSFASTLVPFSVNGSRGRDNNFIIDSVNNNEPLFGGAATQFSNPDIISDYAVLTAAPKAEFGRNSGATVNVITKNGSSKVHGTLFWFGQDSDFNAMTQVDLAADQKSPPPFYENKIGGTFGGPIRQSAFYFVSYQWDRAREDLSNVFPVIATLPTATGLASLKAINPPTPALQSMLAFPSVTTIPGEGGRCFSAVPATTGSGTTTATPPSTSNPCFETGGSGVANPAGIQFGTYLVPQGNLFDLHDHQASARIDKRLDSSNDLYGRYLIDDLETPQAVLDPAGEVAFSDLGLLPNSRSVLRQRTQSIVVDERLARGNSLNEARFSFSRIAQATGAFGLPSSIRNSLPAATVADNFGGFGAYGGNFPSAGVQFTLGQDTSTNVAHSNVFEVQENYSWTHNRHFIKAGPDFIRTQSNILNVSSDLGHYFFGSAGYSGGLASFLNEPASGSTNALGVFEAFPNVKANSAGVNTGQGPNELPLREFDTALFFQDDFRFRPSVTFSVGIRYERFGQPLNSLHDLNSAAPTVNGSGNDFGPRVGVAWALGSSRKTVIRGGYSLMYNQMPLNIPLLVWQSGPVSPLISTITAAGAQLDRISTIVPTSGVYPNVPLTLQDINVNVAGCSSFVSRVTAGSVPLIDCSTQNTVASNLTSPRIQTFSAGVQRALSLHTMVEIDYVGTRGSKLYQRLDTNPYTGWDPTCLQSSGVSFNCLGTRVNPDRGDITSVTNEGTSTYNGLQASLTTRPLHFHQNTVALTAAYTWSHMIDTASEIFGPGVRFMQGDFVGSLLSPETQTSVEAITPFPQDSNDLKAERGNSSFDRRQRLAVSEIWGLPSPSGRPAKAVLGGWRVNGIATLQSGQPFSALNGVPLGSCSDANGDGLLTNDRPDIGNPHAPANSVALLDDTQCLTANPALQTQYPGHSSSSGYIDLAGNSIAPSAARFVQVPLGTKGGNSGRNILTGPGITDIDFALIKQVHWGESRTLEFRWEVYDVFNEAIYGFLLGNVFASNAQPTPGFAFSPRATAAGITGSVPENAIDSINASDAHDFLSRNFMNTGNRTMQFALHLTF